MDIHRIGRDDRFDRLPDVRLFVQRGLQHGLPGVSIVTTEFRDAIAVQSRALGFEPAVVYVPHPVQTPGVLIGWILPMIPISLSIGLVHPLGHAEIAMRILTGISFPKRRRSISLARDKESIFAKTQRSIPGHEVIFTISSRSEPTGVPVSERPRDISSR